MSNLLNQDDKLESIAALQEFCFACKNNHGAITVNIDILFRKGRKLAFTCSAPIVIGSNSAIYIMWEEAGYTQEQFREIDLYGVYYSEYVKMKYLKTKKILEINSSDSNKIIRIYAKDTNN
ncbi:hypothetical protein Z959_07895 [Clostridium novyi B str. ATCC 27606]|uniref:Uncharacterized protein n=1 Tax=Clostridium novyi B str. ATCC 27606 TaxID=1443123 RepID=A0AA40IVL5_CLONO|nr:hypothetical protein [Clostridium novyi]KEI16991.1 hypothetical protein Z959_07895 [Clostridium novyi B str. ATCC 27606]